MNKPAWNKDYQAPHSWDTMFFGASNGVGILPTPNSGFRTFHPVVDHDVCIHCNLCWIYCPEGCIEKETGKMIIDMDYCKGCGICANECPKKCIKMVKDGDLDE